MCGYLSIYWLTVVTEQANGTLETFSLHFFLSLIIRNPTKTPITALEMSIALVNLIAPEVLQV
jgi:hypothetical protein